MSWIHCQALLKDCHGQTVDSITNGTMAGTFTSDQVFLLHEITFPEFSSLLHMKKYLHIYFISHVITILFLDEMCVIY